MTRGKVIYINNDSQVYATCEFNGDMHLYRHGEDILERFKNGLFQNYDGYEKFVECFNRKYFIYELDYGRRYKLGMITDENGQDIDIHTPDLLYDFISNSGVICQEEV